MKKYNIDYYNEEKAKMRKKYFADKSLFSEKGIDTNRIFFNYILDELKKNSKKTLKILDLCTGTGYVPKTLCQLTKNKFKIIGIDLAKEMLAVAEKGKQDKRINYKLANNFKLPFKNGSFDIITNKLSTQFSFKEVYRVLKKDGIFIFKEYGEFKGFKEIKKIFNQRFKKSNKSIDDYLKEIEKNNYKEIILQRFLIKRDYKLSEIENIFYMANLIENFKKLDLQKIKSKLMKNSTIRITSDPFIIFLRK